MPDPIPEYVAERIWTLEAEVQQSREALEAADALAEAVLAWRSHVVLEGLAGAYRSARPNA